MLMVMTLYLEEDSCGDGDDDVVSICASLLQANNTR